MSTDVLSHFGVLDELIQVIYQGLDRFVALSQVTESAWSIYLGLKGPEGRWWRGSWSAPHILNITGVQSGPQVLDTFAEKLRTTFVNGDLTIGAWTEGESDINLTFGRTAKHPLHMALKSLSAAEAASHATAVFTEIALQAQSRKCQLNPSFPSRNVITVIPESSHANSATTLAPKRTPLGLSQDPVPAAVNPVAERKIKALEAELARSKERSPPGDTTSTKPSASSRPPKGASLANPNKKARKYQALEFESDED